MTASTFTDDTVSELRALPNFFVEFNLVCGNDAREIASLVIEFIPEWAPRGVYRVHELVSSGFFDQAPFFRVIPGKIAQFGIAVDPKSNARWHRRMLRDDPVVGSNSLGTIAFAMAGQDTRTTQLFINMGNNEFLDQEGYAPVGRIISGDFDKLKAVEVQHQGRLEREGYRYIRSKGLKQLSFIVSSRFVGHNRMAERTLVQCSIQSISNPIVIDIHEEWAPHGAERFLDLVNKGYYDGTAIFYSVRGSLIQFGIPADVKIHKEWSGKTIPDDIDMHIPLAQGIVSFAANGPDTRDTQILIPLTNLNNSVGATWERPIGNIIEGKEAIESLFNRYGDVESALKSGPDLNGIYEIDGYDYLKKEFQFLKYFEHCKIISIRNESTGSYLHITHTQHHKIALAMSPPSPSLRSYDYGPKFTQERQQIALKATTIATFSLLFAAALLAFYYRVRKRDPKKASKHK